MALFFLALVGASWLVEAGGAAAALFDRRLAVARVVVGAVFLQRTWVVARQLPEPDLVPVVEFVLIALGAKLFYRRNNRDDVHIIVLSFLLVLAAAALGGNFLFAFGFMAYVLAVTWALVLFHLRREMEENYLIKHSAQAPSQKVGVARILASRRVVGASFFVATEAVVACVRIAGAFSTFALVPRIGPSFVFGAAHSSANLIGFSDDVTLEALRNGLDGERARHAARGDPAHRRAALRGRARQGHERAVLARHRLRQLRQRSLDPEPPARAAHRARRGRARRVRARDRRRRQRGAGGAPRPTRAVAREGERGL